MPYTPDPGPNRGDIKRGRRITRIEYRPQIQSIRRERGKAKRDYESLLADLEASRSRTTAEQTDYGREAGANLQDIYADLAQRLEASRGAVAQTGQAARGRILSGFDEALTETQSGGQQAQENLARYAQQLGLQAAAPEGLAGLEAELAKIGARTQGAKASELGNIENLMQAQYGTSTQAIDASRQEAAQEQAHLKNEVAGAIGQANLEYAQGAVKLSRGTQEALIDIGGRLSDALGAKGSALKENIQNVFEARSDRERQAYMDNLQEEIQRAQLAMEQQRIGIAARAQRLDERKARMEAAAEKGVDQPYRRMQKWMNQHDIPAEIRGAVSDAVLEFHNDPTLARAAMEKIATEKSWDLNAMQKALNVYLAGGNPKYAGESERTITERNRNTGSAGKPVSYGDRYAAGTTSAKPKTLSGNIEARFATGKALKESRENVPGASTSAARKSEEQQMIDKVWSKGKDYIKTTNPSFRRLDKGQYYLEYNGAGWYIDNKGKVIYKVPLLKQG